MLVEFTKMQGLGNDFVLLDGLRYRGLFSEDKLPDLAKRLCDRRFGIGADQLLLLLPSQIADFRMDIYNADGSRVEMCGNGIRCLANYIWTKGYSDREVLEVETLAGIKRPKKKGALVEVDMGEPIFEPQLIPVEIKQNPPIIDYPLEIDGVTLKITCVSMGNPHAVVFLQEDLNQFDVAKFGQMIENHTTFPKRTNVEFVNPIDKGRIKMRVWERGAGETLACGTGASASAVASGLKGLTNRLVDVELPGGILQIHWAEDNHVYMTGPAEEVFEGRIELGIH